MIKTLLTILFSLVTTVVLAVTAGTVSVTQNDTVKGHLSGKLVAGTGVSLTLGNSGANETLTIANTAVSPDLSLYLRLDQTSSQTIANGQPILSSLTASQIVATDANKKLQTLAVATYPSLTELSYVKGVSSAIQTQIGTKQPQLNGTGFVKASGTTISYDNSTYLTTVTAHNVLSATHGDSTAGSVARGDVITGQGSTPKWTRLAKGSANQVLSMNGTGTDVIWANAAAGGGGGWTDNTTYTEATADYGILGTGSAINNTNECDEQELGDEGSCAGAGCVWFDDGYCEGAGECSIQATEAFCNNLDCDPGWTSGVTSCIADASAAIPDNTAGTMTFWYPQRGAFRAGKFTGTEWHDANVGMFSAAFGKNTTASGNVSFAAGRDCLASGNWATCIGLGNQATSDGSIGMGTSCQATASGAVCIGRQNIVSGTGAVAMGYANTASGEACFVVGDTSFCEGLGSVTLGAGSKSVGLGSVAIGGGVLAGIDGAFALGNVTISQAQNATSMGYGTKAYGVNSMAVNDNTYTGHTDAFAMNASTMAAGPSSLSGGYKSVVTGSEAIGFGNNVICRGASSTCFGESNVSSGKANFVAGSTNTVSGLYSYAIGRDCTVSGDNSFCVNLGTDTGTDGICYNSGQYPCGNDDENETACLAHGCTYEGSNCNQPPEKPTVEPCGLVPTGEYSGGEALCNRMIGCTWDSENYLCAPDDTCSALETQSTCQAQTGCNWAETFTENAETVSANGAFVVMNGRVGIETASPRGALDVDGYIYAEDITTGYALCFTASHQLGHCTNTPTNGACSCTVN